MKSLQDSYQSPFKKRNKTFLCAKKFYFVDVDLKDVLTWLTFHLEDIKIHDYNSLELLYLKVENILTLLNPRSPNFVHVLEYVYAQT